MTIDIEKQRRLDNEAYMNRNKAFFVVDKDVDKNTGIMKPISVDELRNAFKTLANDKLKGVLSYTEDPIVSVDIIGNPNSCIIDGLLITVIGNLVRVVGWYDNEVGYSNRLVDLILKMA